MVSPHEYFPPLLYNNQYIKAQNIPYSLHSNNFNKVKFPWNYLTKMSRFGDMLQLQNVSVLAWLSPDCIDLLQSNLGQPCKSGHPFQLENISKPFFWSSPILI